MSKLYGKVLHKRASQRGSGERGSGERGSGERGSGERGRPPNSKTKWQNIPPKTAWPKTVWYDRPIAKHLFRGGELVAIMAVIAGLIALFFEFRAQGEGRIVRAWALLTTQAPGNSGKREALEYLYQQGQPLPGIDLSCAHMKGGWDGERESCARRVFLQGVKLPNAYLWEADFSGANLWEADFSGANLWVADFNGAKRLERVNFSGAWAWSDRLPEALAGIEIEICPEELRGVDWQLKPAEGCALTIMQ